MKILISGSHGLIGSRLFKLLIEKGHEPWRLVRSSIQAENEISWNDISEKSLEPFQAIVHLAGESIASRWTANKKKRIRDSRVENTKKLVSKLSNQKVFVCASAIGIYGEGFLADVCIEWEQACLPVLDKKIRLVNTRFGIVLSKEGGALKQMLLPFSLGLGGRVSDGKQYMSWISISDAVSAIYHCIINDHISGPINVVAPNPVRNEEFTKTLGKVLKRPTIFPLPKFLVKLALQEMGEELLLSSIKVEPDKLLQSGFKFQHEELESALRSL